MHSDQRFPATSISLSSKSSVSIIFCRAENDQLQRRDKWLLKYLFTTWFTLVPEKDLVKLTNTFSLFNIQ